MIALLLACAGGLDLGRAVVLAPGDVRWSAGAEVSVATATSGPEQETPLPWISPMVGARSGLAPGWDVGARGWLSGWPGVIGVAGVAADARVQLRTSTEGYDPTLSTGLVLGLNRPVVGGTAGYLFSADVPVWVGFPTEDDELTFTPRAGAVFVTSRGQSPFLCPRMGFGVAWHASLATRDVVPQVAWGWSPVPFDGALDDPDRRGFHTFELGIAWGWSDGGPRESAAAGAR